MKAQEKPLLTGKLVVQAYKELKKENGKRYQKCKPLFNKVKELACQEVSEDDFWKLFMQVEDHKNYVVETELPRSGKQWMLHPRYNKKVDLVRVSKSSK